MTSRPRPSARCATERRTPRRAASALVLLLVLLLASGCLEAVGGSTREPDAGAPPRAPDLRAQVQQLLDRRARAVREGDERAFVRQLGRGDGLRVRQLRWFRSVTQLPWQRFDYEVLDTDWDTRPVARWGRTVLVPTIVHRTRLRGFDRRVVERDVGLAVSFDGERPLIVSDRDAAGRLMLHGTPAPWDLTAVQVRRAPGVLGVFDEDTVAAAPRLLAAVSDGLASLERALPFRGPGRVVVYHVRDRRALDTVTDVPGGSLDLLGALTVPTYSRPEISPVASVRMLVLPVSVEAGEPFLGRLVRHELAHVALGPRDDGAPTWLSEGLAEYVGASALPRAQRQIPTVAVRRAQQPPRGMPSSRSFNGPDQDWHYALSWMALDHVAATAGEPALWSLLEAFEARPAGPDDEGVDRVLRAELGYDAAGLARRAAARIRDLYGPGA